MSWLIGIKSKIMLILGALVGIFALIIKWQRSTINRQEREIEVVTKKSEIQQAQAEYKEWNETQEEQQIKEAVENAKAKSKFDALNDH